MNIYMTLNEFKKKRVRKERIRNGKKVVQTEWEYSDVPDGYKVQDGKLVRMSPEERKNRSLAAKKSANKASTKRKKANSMRRRGTLIKPKKKDDKK